MVAHAAVAPGAKPAQCRRNVLLRPAAAESCSASGVMPTCSSRFLLELLRIHLAALPHTNLVYMHFCE